MSSKKLNEEGETDNSMGLASGQYSFAFIAMPSWAHSIKHLNNSSTLKQCLPESWNSYDCASQHRSRSSPGPRLLAAWNRDWNYAVM